jgi:hypothetical protein
LPLIAVLVAQFFAGGNGRAARAEPLADVEVLENVLGGLWIEYTGKSETILLGVLAGAFGPHFAIRVDDA